MDRKVTFGDVPGHDFHGNQWTAGMTAMKEGMTLSGKALAASHNDLFSQVAHAASQGATQIYGPTERARNNADAEKAHLAAGKALSKINPKAADLHTAAAYAHARAASAFRASNAQNPIKPPFGRRQFGRNVVSQVQCQVYPEQQVVTMTSSMPFPKKPPMTVHTPGKPKGGPKNGPGKFGRNVVQEFARQKTAGAKGMGAGGKPC
jgi:hypothetical protein